MIADSLEQCLTTSGSKTRNKNNKKYGGANLGQTGQLGPNVVFFFAIFSSVVD